MDMRFELGLASLLVGIVAIAGGVRARMVRRASETGASDPKAGITQDSLAWDERLARRSLPLVAIGAALLAAGLAARWTGSAWGAVVALVGVAAVGSALAARLVAAELARLRATKG